MISKLRVSSFVSLPSSQHSRHLRRVHRPSSSHAEPSPELAQWISDITSRPPIISSELLDPHRANHLSRALPTRQDVPPQPLSESLPEGHHLVYFQPEVRLSDLGRDGASTEYNPPSPFLRRMWAGGSMHFRSPLKIGQSVTQRVSVPSIDFKKGMVFVNQQRDLYSNSSLSGEDWAIREIRTHVFRRDEDIVNAAKERSHGPPPPTSPPHHTDIELRPPDTSFTYTPTSPLLFLFSALTHNAHKIHYDRPWTQDIEGHPDLLVHAPLTALLLLELAGKEGKVTRFDYRATSPTYVDKETRLSGQWAGKEGDGGRELDLTSEQEGRVGMRASAVIANE